MQYIKLVFVLVNAMYSVKVINLNDKSIKVNLIGDKRTSLVYLIFYFKDRTRFTVLNSSIDITIADGILYLSSDSAMLLDTMRFTLADSLYTLYVCYLLTLQTVGLGYKFVIKESYLYLFLGYSHLIKVKLSRCLKIEKSVRCLRIIYKNKYVLGNVYSTLKKLKKKDSYGGKGIKRIYDKIILKIGKVNVTKK